MKPKLKYSGPWAEASGYAQANRNIIQALHDSGVDVTTELQIYANNNTDYGKEIETCRSLQNRNIDYSIKVLHITPNVYPKHKEVGKYHVGHLFWETTLVSKRWQWYLREVDEIWTGSEYNKKCFIDSGFDREIRIFPQPIASQAPTTETIEIENSKGFVFLSIFQWIERKNPRALLEAYWREFDGDQNVTLVIKTYGLAFSQEENGKFYKQIEEWKKEIKVKHPRVLVIDYLLTDGEKHKLIESCDCFVSAHRGEGWGVPQAESLLHEKPVISTGLGGIHEWISDKGMIKIPYTMTNVFGMPWAEQYTEDQMWADIKVDELRKAMRKVYNDREYAKKVGKTGHDEAMKKLNYKTVGNMMKKRILEIEEKIS